MTAKIVDEQYNAVVAVIEELQKSGEKITVRNVMARSGGATAKIIKYINKWRDSQLAAVSKASSTMSDDYLDALRKLIIAEQVKLVQSEVAELTKQLSSKDQLLNELAEINNQLQLNIDEKSKQIKSAGDQVAKYEQEISGLGKDIEALNRQHEKEVELLNKQIHSLEAKFQEANNLVYDLVRKSADEPAKESVQAKK